MKYLRLFAWMCAVALAQPAGAQNGQVAPKGAQAFKQVAGPVKSLVLVMESGMDTVAFDPAGHITHAGAVLTQHQSGTSQVWSYHFSAGDKTYTYDAEGRLSEFQDLDGTKYHDFVYDMQGKLQSYLINDQLKHAFTYKDGALERLTVYNVSADGTAEARPDNIFLDDATIFDDNGNWIKTDCWGPSTSERVLEYYEEWEL